MSECYQVKDPQELVDYLRQLGRDAYYDWNYQLKTNSGFVHELENGQVVFFDNYFKYKAILFDSRKCFDNILQADWFPVENPEKGTFENEGDRMKTFHLQSDYYRRHLNQVLKFDFPEITKEAAQVYLRKVIGRFIRKMTTSTDVVALISVIGELVKQETNGRWFLKKRYGMYNPIYEPNIVKGNNNVVLISSKIIGQIKWRVSSLDQIFIDVHSPMTEPVSWNDYTFDSERVIMLE